MVAYESISNLPIVCFFHSADRCNAFQSQFVFIKSQTFLNIRVLRERMKGIRLCREEEKGNVAWQWNLYIGIDATFSGSWGWSRVPFATDEIDGDEKQQKNESIQALNFLLVTNFSAGRAPSASFMTLMTSSPTCLDISGFTSLNTSCEFSFRKLFTVSPEMREDNKWNKLFR